MDVPIMILPTVSSIYTNEQKPLNYALMNKLEERLTPRSDRQRPTATAWAVATVNTTSLVALAVLEGQLEA